MKHRRAAIVTVAASLATGIALSAQSIRLTSVQDVIALVKRESMESVISAIDRSGAFVPVFTSDDLKLVTESGLDQKVVDQVMYTQLGKLENMRQLRQTYFPIEEGAQWTYRFTIDNALAVPSSLLRKPFELSPPYTATSSRTTTYTAGKRQTVDGIVQYEIDVSNNLLEPYPWSFEPNLKPEHINALKGTMFADYQRQYSHGRCSRT